MIEIIGLQIGFPIVLQQNAPDFKYHQAAPALPTGYDNLCDNCLKSYCHLVFDLCFNLGGSSGCGTARCRRSWLAVSVYAYFTILGVDNCLKSYCHSVLDVKIWFSTLVDLLDVGQQCAEDLGLQYRFTHILPSLVSFTY
ncbi:hypothetical protein CEXT_491281 [Caerostris extrusa]|uniref:Uncharacterized protein n=1 Tax=Caerostris extrusa TaxID=172846 RepID=A0AAV4SX21_CAEEX|nr:hypothetical protein CEXT_491281 [Caerostris extrusa]